MTNRIMSTKYMRCSSAYTYFLALFVFVNLQALRGVTLLYMVIPIVLYAILFLKYLDCTKRSTQLYRSLLLYALFNFYIIGISIADVGMTDTLTAAPRALFVFPLFFLSYAFVRSEERLLKLLALYVFIVAIGAMSLVFQQFFGAISWLAESSSRGNLVRYASILGALPIYGVAGGFALVLLPTVRSKLLIKVLLLIIITIGMFLTLQKAAIVNLFVAYSILFIILFKTNKARRVVMFSFGFVAVLMISYIAIFSLIEDHVKVALNFANMATDDNKIYVGNDLQEDLVNRLTGGLLGDLNMVDFVMGIGYRGVGGAVGIEGEMAHNAFGDLLLLGGIPYLLVFSFIFMSAFVLTFKRIRSGNISRQLGLCIIGFFVIFFINFPVFSGILINPSLCSVLWVTLGYLANSKIQQNISMLAVIRRPGNALSTFLMDNLCLKTKIC